jgi:single-strand DNA-binding protein
MYKKILGGKSVNKVFLIGNLTRDPEMRSTQSGVAVCNFSIAVNRRFKNANGQQETDYLNVIAWRQLAELCGKYLAKGRKVAVTGSIQTRTYKAKDGSKRTAWDIVADEVEFLSQNQQSSTQSAPGAYTTAVSKDSGTAYAPQPHNDFGGFTQVDDEELPF